MTAGTTTPKQYGLQAAAVLLLCRFVLFVCSDVSFHTGYLMGTLIGIGLQYVILLPFRFGRKWLIPPRRLLLLYRLAAIYIAGITLAAVYELLQGLQSAYPVPTLLLMILAAGYALTLPRRATGRAAVILLCVLAAGLVIVIAAAIPQSQPLLIYTPVDAPTLQDAIASGIRQNLPFALLPVCTMPDEAAPKRCRSWLTIYLVGQLLPALVILMGILCSGHLLHWKGNPFFLLLAQLQRTTAIRCDGFWIALLILAAILVLTFLMQIFTTTCPERTPHTGGALLIGLLWLGAGALFIMYGASRISSVLLLVLAIVLPLPMRIADKPRRHRERSRP